jgi:hypothetical protein
MKMIVAKTLVHAASMPIARHAVRTFCITHQGLFRELEIHTDGSLTEEHRSELVELTGGMAFRFVEPDERRDTLKGKIGGFPEILSLMSGRGYFSKMELPMVSSEPYFYFDSDIVWLRPCTNLTGDGSQNLFSTETWTWYPGIRKELSWARASVPRRVNSGFYYLADPFPFERLERLLTHKMYDPEIPYATDQEIMAFLYPRLRLYHADDLIRSRRGIMYDLLKTKAAALHFPGKMWESHLDRIESFHPDLPANEVQIPRLVDSVPLGVNEIIRMRVTMALAQTKWTQFPADLYRSLRAKMHSI